MASLYDFLKERGVAVEQMEEDKVDESVIVLMNDSELEKYIPKYGDRIAAVSFAKQNEGLQNASMANPTECRKRALMTRLQDRLAKRSKLVGDGNVMEKHSRVTSLLGNRNAKRVERRIELGWLDFDHTNKMYKQVKTMKGGGTRQMKVSVECSTTDILQKSVELFFPNGYSNRGDINNYEYHLSDFSTREIPKEKNIEELYNETKMKMMRMYLATKLKGNHSDVLTIEDCHANTPETGNNTILETIATQTMHNLDTNKIEESTVDTEHYDTRASTSSSAEAEDISTASMEQHNNIHEMTNLLLFDTSAITADIGNYDLDDSRVVSFPLLNNQTDEPTITDNNVVQSNTYAVKLHRGHVLKEFMDFFIVNNEMDLGHSYIEVEMILPNGVKEAGEDNGGIVRDALSEFWTGFYDTVTVGQNVKVPALTHTMTADHWRACAKILFLGYKQEGYFPIQLAFPFLSSVIEGADSDFSDKTELIKTYMEFVPNMENMIFNQALKDFDKVEFDDLLDALDAHEVRIKPTKDNISSLIEQVAHKELIQAPAFIAECWSNTFRLSLLPILKCDLRTLCSELVPTARKVLHILDIPGDLPNNEKETTDYLRKYIKGLSDEKLRIFLRFVTGSDLLVVKKITIRLTEASSDFTRRPVAHTCGAVLEIPKTYDSYLQFRHEFNSILDANIWIMDII